MSAQIDLLEEVGITVERTGMMKILIKRYGRYGLSMSPYDALALSRELEIQARAELEALETSHDSP